MFLEKVRRTLKKYNMLNFKDRVFVGVSGGPDSVALLHTLYRLREEFGIVICVGHFNHMFHQEFSKNAKEFVKSLAEELGLPYILREVDVPEYMKRKRLSPEEAARELRYDFFNEEAKRCNANKIATGHTADDQAETVLFRIIKGSGSRGIRGIPPVRDNKFIRPLIDLNRKDIEDFLKRNNIKYLLDPSNIEPIYLRNKIRLELIPILKKEYNPNIIEALNNLSYILAVEDDFIEGILEDISNEILCIKENNRIEIDISSFSKHPLVIQRGLIRRGIELLNKEIKGVSFKHISDILQLLDKNVSGKSLNLPKGLVVRKEYNKLIFTKNEKDNFECVNYNYNVKVPGEISIQIGKFSYRFIFVVKEIEKVSIDFENKNIAFLDFDKTGEVFVIRNRRPGDKFHPLGMKGKKNLKEYFIDEKIPKRERDTLPLIAKNSNILWVTGKRISEDVKLTERSEKALMIEVCIT